MNLNVTRNLLFKEMNPKVNPMEKTEDQAGPAIRILRFYSR